MMKVNLELHHAQLIRYLHFFYPSLSHPSPGFSGVRAACSFIFCVLVCRSLYILLSFFICSLCCILQFTDSDYPIGIFKFFLKAYHGLHSFRFAGATLWNELPNELRNVSSLS